MSSDARTRMLQAAERLLAEGGREAVSTRAVSAAAGVQPPALYRQFGDMRSLLDAVAGQVLQRYVAEKSGRQPLDDPVEELRRGWDEHIEFALTHSAAYALIYGEPEGRRAAAHAQGLAVLRGLLERVAAAGRLGVPVPHAARAFSAAGEGVALALIATPPDQRDPQLSATVRDALLRALTHGAAPPGARPAPATHAIALRTALAQTPDPRLSEAEQALLAEWLDRLSAPGEPRPG